MRKNETKFWHEVKNAGWNISFTRIENSLAHGTPYVLCQNKNMSFLPRIKVKLC